MIHFGLSTRAVTGPWVASKPGIDNDNNTGSETMNRRRFASCALCAVVGLVASRIDADAQAPGGVTRTILQKTE
jgi:hypothetical protein